MYHTADGVLIHPLFAMQLVGALIKKEQQYSISTVRTSSTSPSCMRATALSSRVVAEPAPAGARGAEVIAWRILLPRHPPRISTARARRKDLAQIRESYCHGRLRMQSHNREDF